MKRISIFLAAALFLTTSVVRAQDAATEERLNKLNAQFEALLEAKNAQNRRIEELAKAIESLQQQLNKPNVDAASQEDVKRLAENLREIDRKRMEDNERIVKELKKLGAAAMQSAAAPLPPAANNTPATPSKGYKYTIQSGDTLSVIIAAYKEKGIKVTVDQILKANPGLKPEKMKVGQEIFIPAPGAAGE
jgi:LysM repeat protein